MPPDFALQNSSWAAGDRDRLVADLRAAVQGCDRVSLGIGLGRAIGLGLAFGGSVLLAWGSVGWGSFVGWSAIAGITYSFWVICSHDAIHHTLTGLAWLDEAIARLVSWPIMSVVGVYSELHKLHHGWNGVNLDDPERVQRTATEYEQAGPWRRWYFRHQWAIDLFGLGAIGILLRNLRQGWQRRGQSVTIRRQLWIDGVGIVVLHLALFGWALAAGAIGRYLVFWVVVERIVGIIIQAREHLEHYGLWRSSHSHLLTQLYATRNVQAIGLVNWLMGGLPYHSIHHAFPGIPFDRLPEAFDRVQAVLADHGQPPLVVAPGYWPGSWQLSRDHQALIATAIDPQPQRSPT